MSENTKRIERRRAAMISKGWVYATPGKPGVYVQATPKTRQQINKLKVQELLQRHCHDPELLAQLLASFATDEDA